MKQITALFFVLLLGGMLWRLTPALVFNGQLGHVAQHYVDHSLSDNKGSNIVTSIVVNYRGFDTFGEVSVLFLSVAGALYLLRRRRGLQIAKAPVPSSEIVRTGTRLLFAPMVLLGAYVFVHGHLTPGGGFQGGSIIATAVLLLLLSDSEKRLPHGFLTWLESLSGLGFALVGLVGLAIGGSFLSNKGVMGLGEWNRLFSAGVIPIIYVLIGLKVGAELSALLDDMTHSRVTSADDQEVDA